MQIQLIIDLGIIVGTFLSVCVDAHYNGVSLEENLKWKIFSKLVHWIKAFLQVARNTEKVSALPIFMIFNGFDIDLTLDHIYQPIHLIWPFRGPSVRACVSVPFTFFLDVYMDI